MQEFVFNKEGVMTEKVINELNRIFNEIYYEYDSLIPKLKRIKTHVLTFSPKFLKGHPKEGQQTGFIDSILNDQKITTCRGNYDLWSKRIDEVNKGNAVISLRYWSKKPFTSPQVEFKIVTNATYDRIKIMPKEKLIICGGVKLIWTADSFISDEGFVNVHDFWGWFKDDFEGICINFG